jgi:hypothetical protein
VHLGKDRRFILCLNLHHESMYARILRRAAHIRRFTITTTSSSGWEVREEEDSRIITSRLYDDWHRVERARFTFAAAEARLRGAGWEDV